MQKQINSDDLKFKFTQKDQQIKEIEQDLKVLQSKWENDLKEKEASYKAQAIKDAYEREKENKKLLMLEPFFNDPNFMKLQALKSVENI